MRVYAGTYQGHLLILQGSPFALTPIATRTVSEVPPPSRRIPSAPSATPAKNY